MYRRIIPQQNHFLLHVTFVCEVDYANRKETESPSPHQAAVWLTLCLPSIPHSSFSLYLSCIFCFLCDFPKLFSLEYFFHLWTPFLHHHTQRQLLGLPWSRVTYFLFSANTKIHHSHGCSVKVLHGRERSTGLSGVCIGPRSDSMFSFQVCLSFTNYVAKETCSIPLPD